MHSSSWKQSKGRESFYVRSAVPTRGLFQQLFLEDHQAMVQEFLTIYGSNRVVVPAPLAELIPWKSTLRLLKGTVA